MKWIFVSACLIAAGCSNEHSATTPRVRLAMPSVGLMVPAVYLADSLGQFQQHGLDVRMSEMPSGAKALEALIGGSADIAVVTQSHVQQVAVEGRNVRAFVCLTNGDSGVLVASPVADPPIRRISDLKARKAGITGFGSSSHMQLNWFLHRSGMNKEDVQIIAAGSIVSQAAALSQGRIDSAMLGGSAFTALKRKHPKLMVLADLRTPETLKRWVGVDALAGFSVAARAEWLQANPAIARQLAKSLTATMRWMREHTPEEILAQVPDRHRMPDAEADLEAIRDVSVMLTPDGRFRPEGVEAARKLLAVSAGEEKVATLDLAKTYTNEFVEER